jgi:hypothetical protein
LHTGKEHDEDGEVVPGKKVRMFGHGIWSISNEVIYYAILVSDGEKVFLDTKDWKPYALEIISLEAEKCIGIDMIDYSEGIAHAGESAEFEERRIEE